MQIPHFLNQGAKSARFMVASHEICINLKIQNLRVHAGGKCDYVKFTALSAFREKKLRQMKTYVAEVFNVRF